MSGEAKPGLLFIIGLGCLAGAAVLFWLSSIQTLQFTRVGDDVTVALRSRLFGVVTTQETWIDHVRTATTVTTLPEPGSRGHAFTRLFFETPSGPVNLWSTQTEFIRQSSEMKDFFDDPAQSEATFSTLIDWRERARFVFAQLAALFLASCGTGVLYMAAKGLVRT